MKDSRASTALVEPSGVHTARFQVVARPSGALRDVAEDLLALVVEHADGSSTPSDVVILRGPSEGTNAVRATSDGVVDCSLARVHWGKALPARRGKKRPGREHEQGSNSASCQKPPSRLVPASASAETCRISATHSSKQSQSPVINRCNRIGGTWPSCATSSKGL